MLLNSFANRLCICALMLLSIFGMVHSAAVPANPQGLLDNNKVYPPDPPAGTAIMMGIKYFDEKTQERQTVDFVIHLFKTVTPKAVRNFISISKGVSVVTDPKKPKDLLPLGYKNNDIYLLEPNNHFEAGHFFDHTGFSIFGDKFEDENFDIKHDRPGRVSLVSRGPNTNDAKFMIDLNVNGSPERDGKNVVFGQVAYGLEGLLEAMKNVRVDNNNKPVHEIKIEFVVVDELKISNLDSIHKEWLENKNLFDQGDMSKGFSFQSRAIGNAKEAQNLNDIKYADYNHPILKIILLFAVLAIFYLSMKNKELIKSKIPFEIKKRETSIRSD